MFHKTSNTTIKIQVAGKTFKIYCTPNSTPFLLSHLQEFSLQAAAACVHCIRPHLYRLLGAVCPTSPLMPRLPMTLTLPDSMGDYQSLRATAQQHLSQLNTLLSQNTWFSSCLTDCTFSIIFTDSASSFQSLRCWSIQGSFFTKFIFSVYNQSLP